MRKRPLLQMLVIGAIGIAIGIPLALIIPWFPTEGSVQAGRIHTLYDVLLIASVPIFVLVMTVVLYSVVNFRMRPGDEAKDGPPIHGNTRLEVVWTALPAVLIISLCTYAYTVLRANENKKSNEQVINVTARQFAFEFSYPEANGKTVVSSQLYMAKGRPIVFKLHSLDVVHSFFVPDFSVKLDAVPGITTSLRVTPNHTGNFPVECTELCGAGHSLMRAAAHVVTPETFQSWLQSQSASAAPPVGTPPANATQAGIPGASGGGGTSGGGTSGGGGTTTGADTSPAAGKTVFTGSGGCGACHTLSAAGTSGTVGPNLDTRLKSDCALPASKKVRGATLDQCISTAITKPYAFIPAGYHAGVMPSNFGQTLSSTQIQALVNFLASVAK